MKKLSINIIITLIILISFILSTCSSLGSISKIGTTLGVATGKIDKDKAASINKSAEAVSKSFEDITPEQEYYIGRAVGAVILNKYDPYTEPEANKYLNTLGQALAMASNRPEIFGGYHFLILDSDEINAFATPSGLVFISRGLLRCASSEDAVAAILAHEIGHVENKHGLKAIKKSRITTALTSVAITAAQTAGSKELSELTSVFEDSIMDITTTMINKGYSRASEKQADLSAVRIMKRIGYDPWALVEMLEIMDRKLKPGGLDFAKTHPDPKDRIKEIRKELGGQRPQKGSFPERQKRFLVALGNI